MEARTPTIDADLSSWSREQEKLIKKALLEYKSRSPRTRGLSWEGVQRDVENVTGVGMGGKDHFRQFIAGTRPATDDPERRRAMVEFATDPDIDLLSLREFLEPRSFLHAPRRLLEYLRTDLDPVAAANPLDRICGTYESVTELAQDKESRLVLELMRIETESDILKVVEQHTKIHNQESGGKPQTAEAHISSSGWCILTPEDNLLFFLKEDQYGQNHSYQLILDIDIWTDEPRPELTMLRFDYPELREQGRGYSSEKEQVISNTLHKRVQAFTRSSANRASAHAKV